MDFTEPADIMKLKDAAALLRLRNPELALEIERAIDELEELRELAPAPPPQS